MIAVTEHITRADSFQDIPILSKYFKSLASVAGSQLTYTMRLGSIWMTVCNNFSSHPFRGGSSTTTSLRNVPPLSRYFAGTTSSAAPAKNSTLDISFNAAFSRAFLQPVLRFQHHIPCPLFGTRTRRSFQCRSTDPKPFHPHADQHTLMPYHKVFSSE